MTWLKNGWAVPTRAWVTHCPSVQSWEEPHSAQSLQDARVAPKLGSLVARVHRHLLQPRKSSRDMGTWTDPEASLGLRGHFQEQDPGVKIKTDGKEAWRAG